MTYIKSLTLAALLGAAAFGMSGCASISKDECRAGNWQDMGYRDGVNGKARGLLADYANVCTGHGMLVDRPAYLSAYETGLNTYCAPSKAFDLGRRGGTVPGVCAGRPEYLTQHEAGVAQYCIPDNGYERGLSGRKPNQVCATSQYEGYRAGYYDGRAQYEAEQARLRAIQAEHDYLHDAVIGTERELDSVRSRLNRGDVSGGEVRRLQKKLERLKNRRRNQIRDLRSFERANSLDYCY